MRAKSKIVQVYPHAHVRHEFRKTSLPHEPEQKSPRCPVVQVHMQTGLPDSLRCQAQEGPPCNMQVNFGDSKSRYNSL